LTQSRGFGPLEAVDLCQSLGCDPILTLNALELPEDAADLVRRCRSTLSNLRQSNWN